MKLLFKSALFLPLLFLTTQQGRSADQPPIDDSNCQIVDLGDVGHTFNASESCAASLSSLTLSTKRCQNTRWHLLKEADPKIEIGLVFDEKSTSKTKQWVNYLYFQDDWPSRTVGRVMLKINDGTATDMGNPLRFDFNGTHMITSNPENLTNTMKALALTFPELDINQENHRKEALDFWVEYLKFFATSLHTGGGNGILGHWSWQQPTTRPLIDLEVDKEITAQVRDLFLTWKPLATRISREVWAKKASPAYQ